MANAIWCERLLRISSDGSDGNENVEAPRGQRAIVADDFAHIVDIAQNPRSISLLKIYIWESLQ